MFGANLSHVVELNWWSCELSQCQVCCWNLQPLLVSFLGPILGVGRAWRAWSLSKSPKHTINIYQYNHTMNIYQCLLMSINISILLEYTAVCAGLARDQRATRGWLWYHALSDSWMLGHRLGVRVLKTIEKWKPNHIRLHEQIQDLKDMATCVSFWQEVHDSAMDICTVHFQWETMQVLTSRSSSWTMVDWW